MNSLTGHMRYLFIIWESQCLCEEGTILVAQDSVSTNAVRGPRTNKMDWVIINDLLFVLFIASLSRSVPLRPEALLLSGRKGHLKYPY
jgi:hypothetical protein